MIYIDFMFLILKIQSKTCEQNMQILQLNENDNLNIYYKYQIYKYTKKNMLCISTQFKVLTLFDYILQNSHVTKL